MTELCDARWGTVERKLAERLVDQHVAVAFLRDVGQLPNVRTGEGRRCRIVQIREHEEPRPSSRQLPPTVQVESPSTLTVSRNSDNLRAHAPRDVAERGGDREVHEDPVPGLDQAGGAQKVALVA